MIIRNRFFLWRKQNGYKRKISLFLCEKWNNRKAKKLKKKEVADMREREETPAVVLVSPCSPRPVSAQDGGASGENISVSQTPQSSPVQRWPVYDVCLPSSPVSAQRRKWSLILIIFLNSVMNSAILLSLPLLFTKIGNSLLSLRRRKDKKIIDVLFLIQNRLSF